MGHVLHTHLPPHVCLNHGDVTVLEGEMSKTTWEARPSSGRQGEPGLRATEPGSHLPVRRPFPECAEPSGWQGRG